MPVPIAIYYSGLKDNPRLKYVLDWIFKTQWQIDYLLLDDKQQWTNHDGQLKLNYSKEKLPQAQVNIKPQGLLEEVGSIKVQPLLVQRWQRNTVLFYNRPGATVPFDLFSAVFYLISRYEEYLPHDTDKHGRFKAENSVAGQYRFLQVPIIDYWLFYFRQLLKEKNVIFSEKKFCWQLTYDVDMAWQYRHRGKFRYWGGHIRDFLTANWSGIRERRQVISGEIEDSYFSFPELKKLHEALKMRPIYFMLLGRPGKYDRNMPPTEKPMQLLIKELSQHYDLGIHPSYGSHRQKEFLEKEINILANVTQKDITKSRQHFIKFQLPDTYRTLIEHGIKEDYSMGYPSINGFRAGTSMPFYWYDLKKEEKAPLRVFPFAFMDATSRFYQNQTPEEMLREWKKLYVKVEKVNGNFIGIWHNYILSRGSEWLAKHKSAIEFGIKS